MKIPPATVYDTIIRYGETNSFKDKPGRGRKVGSYNKKIDKSVTTTLVKNKSMSVRDIAKKCKTTKSTVQDIKRRHGLKTYKKRKVPKRPPTQLERAKNRSGKLYKHQVEKNFDCILMDDETYVKLDFKTLSGPQFYTKARNELITESEMSIAVEKFEPKILVWQAICQCGKKSTPFFTRGTINAEIYRRECLQKRLKPFLAKHKKSVFFWPDLATAHYAAENVKWYKNNNIEFCDKNMNPPNCPQLRTIEKYWANIKRILIKTGRTAKNDKDFKRFWNAAAKKITERDVQNLMRHVKSKVREFYRGD